MSYTAWMKDFLARRERLESLLRLQGLSDAEIWSYFSWENMRQREPDYCELYAKNQKCHEMESLNCYHCGCPFFLYNDEGIAEFGNFKLISACGNASPHRKLTIRNNEAHNDCSNCTIPHELESISACQSSALPWEERPKS